MDLENKTYIIGTMDVDGFHKNVVSGKENHEAFAFLEFYYQLCEDSIRGKGGKVIKYMGDGILFIIDPTLISAPSEELKEVYDHINSELQNKNEKLSLTMKLHVGEVAIGMIGVGENRKLDIFGEVVNNLYLMKDRGYVVSEAYSKL